MLDTEITVIIPFNEYGDLDDLEFSNSSAFTREARVIQAPELDDMDESDNLYPVRLAVPVEFQVAPGTERRSSRAYRDSHTDTSDGTSRTDVIHMGARVGGHRKADSGVVKARLVAAAMAAGATAAAAYSVVNGADTAQASTLMAAGQTTLDGGFITGSADGIQIVSVAPAASAAVHNEELAKGAAFAQERAEREARLTQPLYVMPTKGAFTSGFGYRWGVLHGGIDIANSIGTPIYAVSDGVVIDVGTDRRLRRMGEAAARGRHRHALRPRQHLAGQRRPAGDGRRSDRHHRQPRQLDRAALPLRGSAQRHRSDRSPAVVGQAGPGSGQVHRLIQ